MSNLPLSIEEIYPGSEFEVLDNYGQTTLMKLCRIGDLRGAQKLVDNGDFVCVFLCVHNKLYKIKILNCRYLIVLL